MLSLNVTRCFALTLYVLLNLPGQPAQQAMAIAFPNLYNLRHRSIGQTLLPLCGAVCTYSYLLAEFER